MQQTLAMNVLYSDTRLREQSVDDSFVRLLLLHEGPDVPTRSVLQNQVDFPILDEELVKSDHIRVV